ncbi:hypothetical protein CPC16_002802 [Podila verticillata]|nr:hypothetical protein BGZ52_004343 [Haplosporangium bisporale]KAF9216511.1 hypothetical protein BGZ59_009316 [Podila verticillata]KAF9393011.1 hypothetical protein CPC16_002802 [Podila verticillata]KFH71151.1 copper/zinc superoxide dismutase [Podila verticillata NRRL 6337]
MQIKAVASALAIASLAAAAVPTTGVAEVKNADGVDVKFVFTTDPKGINVTISGTGLTIAKRVLATGYDYHVHVKPVVDGNCTLTGGHLDPANVGTSKPCDPTNLATCQTGDLAGKHGNFMGTEDGVVPFTTYIDTQLSFSGDVNSTLVGRSVVIHNNGTRIACADIITADATTTSPSGASSTSGAAKLVGSLALSGVVAFMMLAF